MTPGNPWRRGWIRETLLPLLWLACACGVIAFALAGTVHAEPLAAGDVFAIEHAADLCLGLDADPTVNGVVHQIAVLRSLGLSDGDVGVALADSVLYVCPIHQRVVREFVARYQRGVTA